MNASHWTTYLQSDQAYQFFFFSNLEIFSFSTTQSHSPPISPFLSVKRARTYEKNDRHKAENNEGLERHLLSFVRTISCILAY